MYVLVHKFSNFKIVQIIEFRDAEVNVLRSNPIQQEILINTGKWSVRS